ncbi:hypothetical protein GH714_006482 [Hevea brasiliensis]|uniref:Uncharacterized protein n=1 Tax=Hevea brasiliensis TaxID=3981 RepID=A0A6A6L5W7_HEVBR|nr:hypothetical protein GH714_006482 [Hevea brasiliensis]
MNTVVPNLREDTTKLITPKGTTTFFVTDLQKGNLVVPKSIAWEQVNLPDNWILEEAIPPKKEENEDVESIIETNNGTVAISFARNRSRNSSSGRTVVSEPITPRTSLSGIDLDRFSSIGIHRTEEQIAQPIYGPESTVASPTETVSLKRPESPTPSDMGYERESVRTQQPKRIMALTTEESPFEKWFQMTFKLEQQQKFLKEYKWYQDKGNEEKGEFLDDRVFKESVAQRFERMNLQMNDFRDELDVLRGMRNEMTRFMEETRRDREYRNRRNDGGTNVGNQNRNEGRFRAEHSNEGYEKLNGMMMSMMKLMTIALPLWWKRI